MWEMATKMTEQEEFLTEQKRKSRKSLEGIERLMTAHSTIST
jgi:hypothetical protein